LRFFTVPMAGCPTALPCPAVPYPPPALPSDLRQVAIVCVACGLGWLTLAIVCFLAPRQRRGLRQRKSAIVALLFSALSLLIAQRAWAAYLPLASIHLTTFQLEQYFGATYDNSIQPMVADFRGVMVLDMLILAGFTLFLLVKAARAGVTRIRSRRAGAAPYSTV
jgi:hypothetical protein